ncbi:MAG: hypothetical protein FJZ58_04300 [Chlamydiae bacterium]|nr:hypothetical protein [Chlamydiota bacterium]
MLISIGLLNLLQLFLLPIFFHERVYSYSLTNTGNTPLTISGENLTKVVQPYTTKEFSCTVRWLDIKARWLDIKYGEQWLGYLTPYHDAEGLPIQMELLARPLTDIGVLRAVGNGKLRSTPSPEDD